MPLVPRVFGMLVSSLSAWRYLVRRDTLLALVSTVMITVGTLTSA